MAIIKNLILCCLGIRCLVANCALAQESIHAGPVYDSFSLTLAPGRREEFFGPAYYSERKESQEQWAFPPLGLSETEDPTLAYKEFDFLYPLLTYDQYGTEYRWQLFQVLSLAGGQNQNNTSARRFTLFPIYFQQRSTDSNQNYTAVFPLYGHLKNRLFRDEIDFVLFPFYAKTRKKDVVTRNMPYPFFSQSHGEGLEGWQLWPFYGREHKDITTRTNDFGEPKTVPGHDRRFILFPFFIQTTNDIGAANPVRQEALIPFYSLYRSKLRDSTTYFWPLGVTHTLDREKKYDEWDAPWPLIEFARGEGKTTSRVWPFFSEARNQYLQDNWYLWPVYKHTRLTSAPLDRERTRILFFLYSDMEEQNTATGKGLRRTDLFPFFHYKREFNGNERLQVLSVLEPFFPEHKSLERDYAPLYSFWRAEKNPGTGASSQSLLWNLYRRDSSPQAKKISLLFGLFQYQSSPAGGRWRLCYIPMGKKLNSPPEKPPGP